MNLFDKETITDYLKSNIKESSYCIFISLNQYLYVDLVIDSKSLSRCIQNLGRFTLPSTADELSMLGDTIRFRTELVKAFGKYIYFNSDSPDLVTILHPRTRDIIVSAAIPKNSSELELLIEDVRLTVLFEGG